MAEAEAAWIHLTYAGRKHVLKYNPGSHTTVGDLADDVAGLLGLATETIKLLPKLPHGSSVVRIVRDAAQPLQQAGLVNGAAFLVVGSRADEVASVLSAKELPGLAPFEHENRLAAARRSRALPGHHSNRRHSFGPIEPWQCPGLSPPPSAAGALLLRLASDPAIVAVMEAHGWRVGRLTEMPPEGKVGVSAVCILGYNANQGQEISLRLRTDDLRGFRKYLRIRETLVHELAHMVYSEHDSNFKQLNSQLLREVASHEDAARAGGRLLGAAGASKHWLGDDEEEEEWQQQAVMPPAMAASAAHSGKTLRQLAGAAAAGLGTRSASPQQLAAEAAARRWQEQGLSGDPDARDGVSRTPSPMSGSSAGAAAVQGLAIASPEGSPCGRDSVWQDVEAAMQHEDAATSEAEAAMQQLGAVAQPTQPPSDMQATLPAAVGDVDIADGADKVQVAQLADVGPAAGAAAAAPLGSTTAARDTMGAGSTSRVHEHNTASRPQQQQQQQQQPPIHSVVSTPRQELQGQPQPAAHETGLAMQDAVPASSIQPDMDIDLPEGAMDEVTTNKLQQVQAALAHLSMTLTAQEVAVVKQTLQDILERLQTHPEEPKHGRLRLGNATFHRKVGQHGPAMEVLRVAGFEVKEQPAVGGTGLPERVLCYTRRDPGLLWMVKSLLA